MSNIVSALTSSLQTEFTSSSGKMAYMSIGENVKTLRTEKGWSQVELAKRVGVSRVRITQIENDPTAQVKDDTLLGLAKAFGCLPQHLKDGWGSSIPSIDEHPSFIQVPLLDVQLSAGFGSNAEAEVVVETMPVPERLLEELGVIPSNARIVTVKGDSMEKTLSDGERIVVDVSQKRLISEGVYAFEFDGDLKVKRFIKQFNNNWVISSDNKHDPAYQDQTIAPHNAQQLDIKGRVAGILARKL